jgi:hypothetical protein
VHVRRKRWQLLESDHRNLERKPTRGNTMPEREKKDVASTALERKGTVIHH